jgi:hypothetical protein
MNFRMKEVRMRMISYYGIEWVEIIGKTVNLSGHFMQVILQLRSCSFAAP